jgi:hypothetical protein
MADTTMIADANARREEGASNIEELREDPWMADTP